MAAKPEDYKVGELFKKNPDKPKQEAIRGGDPSRRDDIRTEQLTKKGSKAILRDKKTGGILVRKKNNKQVRPFRDENRLKSGMKNQSKENKFLQDINQTGLMVMKN